MGRLIDADDVGILIQKTLFRDEPDVEKLVRLNIAKHVVNEIPTAYDVDRVVDAVKELCRCSIEDESFVKMLIDIIRKGGVE